MPLTEEELMDRAGDEKAPSTAYSKLKETAEIVEAKNTGDQLAQSLLKAAGLDSSGAAPGGKAPGVKNMQRSLASVGMQVRPTGVVDAPTVAAINSIFEGWDDAPATLRGGNLTARQIQANLPVVQRYLRQALHGAQQFGDASKDG